MATHTAMAQGSDASVRSSVEQRIGILHYVSQKEHGWHGQIRTRFTDFQVHEISKDGEVVHLHDFQTNAREFSRIEASSQPAATPQAVQPSQPAATPQTVQPSQSEENPQTVQPSQSEENPAENEADATTTEVQETQPQLVAEANDGDDGDDSAAIPPSDRTILVDIFGQDVAEELIDLHKKATEEYINAGKETRNAQPKKFGAVKIAAITDKAQRTRVHTEIRRIFGGKLDTATDADGSIKATLIGGNSQWGGNRAKDERSRYIRNTRNARNPVQRNTLGDPNQGNDGNFLHFTLYKENRDTMDVIGQIARLLNMRPTFFGTAGTKDRRAVTAQRVSIRRRNPQTLVGLNNDKVWGVKIGDFKFENFAIHLGHHRGNEFVIVAKNCQFNGTEGLAFEEKLDIAKATVESALQQVNQNGFINYYGTQRFGTHQIGTQEVGMKILMEDFEGAVQALLSFNPDDLDISDSSSSMAMRREDVSRAQACSIFLDTGNAQDALKNLHRRFHVETTLIRHLGKQPKDFIGALLSISRSMRTMYVHAYQSLVWNYAASKRWERFGSRVVQGDLVLLECEASASQGNRRNLVDDNEETIHLVDAESIAEDTRGLKAHTITEEEAGSGKYSIFDVVLPSPGWDVVYPDNEIGQFYKDFMAKEENGGLDPQNMLRRQREFSLPGSYRKLMGKFIGTPSASVQAYATDMDQLVPTDLDLIRSRKAKEAAERAAARREGSAPQSAWQGFADNVQENERQEARARTERRKAEETSEAPESRAVDTWVQTATNESNKRIKIAVQTDEIAMKSDNSTSQARGDEMEVDDPTPENKQSTANEDGAVQTGVVDGTESATQENRDSTLSILTTLKSQNPKHNADSEVRPETSTGPLEPTSNGDPQNETGQSTGDEVDRAPDCSKPHHTTGDNKDAVDKSQQSADATASDSTSHVKQPSPPVTTNEKKIAVILRFALNTSQYATIVLRELQGMVPENDKAAEASGETI